jgi:hypothetical protein
METPEKQNRWEERMGLARIVPMSPERFQMKALQFCDAAWHIPCDLKIGARRGATLAYRRPGPAPTGTSNDQIHTQR